MAQIIDGSSFQGGGERRGGSIPLSEWRALIPSGRSRCLNSIVEELGHVMRPLLS